MKATATVRIGFDREESLSAILTALKPETRSEVTSRSKVTVKTADRNLILIFEAADTSALRAAMNSYLHSVRLLKDALDVVKSP